MEGSDGVLGQVEGGEGAGKLAVDRGQVRSLVHFVFIFITDAQWILSFFNSFASTALAISAKLLLKYPFTTFVKVKS